MPKFYLFWQKVIFLPVAILLSASAYGQAQVDTTLTPRYIATGPNSNGFYEYLPKGYVENPSETFPVIISLHGLDELGNGTTQLPNILDNGIPNYIVHHQFPESFSVRGNSYSFIVILPQFVVWPVATDVDDVITYVKQHYRVDTNRVYLTGLSMGGGATWDYASTSTAYASKLAAIFVVCGAKSINSQEAANIADANLPVFATHNLNDPTVPSSTTVDNVDLINASVPPPVIPAIDTIFDATGHDAWTKSYNPATIYSFGLNAYEWMLQYSRDAISVPLPVTLTAYSAIPAANDASVTISWTTAMEQNNKYFILQRSADGRTFNNLDTVLPASPNSASPRTYAYIDEAPLPGQNFYRLTQSNENGNTTDYGILEVSLPATGGKEAFGISPNPCTDHFTIRVSNSLTGQMGIDLIDAQGRLLREWTSSKSGQDWTLDVGVADLPPGQYFIRLSLGGTRLVESFIKL